MHSRFALLLVAAASLAAASLITACETLTVDFVFVASSRAAGANNYGEIDVFRDQLRVRPHAPDSHLAVSFRGPQPRRQAVSADYQNLFVVNQDDNTIVQFVIGSDGKLYPYNTVNTPGIYPAGHRRQQVQRLRGRYLPAASALLHRRSLLGFHRRIPADRCDQQHAHWPGNAGYQPGE